MLRRARDKQAQHEALRVKQQGLGKPVVAAQFRGHQFVAVGNTLHYSPKWRTFADFLSSYIRTTLGAEWGNAEISKPLEDRHPILQWYDAYCAYQASFPRASDDEIVAGPITGAACCYLGLAYSLYLIQHNVELQARLVHRLKNPDEFQGAYYELMVANCLIRAGFDLELEDESDDSSKHCEFAARSQRTGKRYWVEAKMRSVQGVLGKTEFSGSKARDPTSRLSAHLNAALRKPADGPRLIFIDLNADPQQGASEPEWVTKAIRRLESRENTGGLVGDCYVFVTNMSFHRALNAQVGAAVLGYGLGMSDFGKAGPIRLPDWYRNKKKHADAFDIVESIRIYPNIPDTFDGLPRSQQVPHDEYSLLVGERYIFPGAGPGGEDLDATVASVAVDDNSHMAMIAVNTVDDRGYILRRELTDVEFSDYKKYGVAYFGEKDRKEKLESIFDFFEWMVDSYSETSKERLLELAAQGRHPDVERLSRLSRDEVALELCEGWAISAHAQRERNEVR